MVEHRYLLKDEGMGYNMIFDTISDRFIPLQEVVDKLNDGDDIAHKVKNILGE